MLIDKAEIERVKRANELVGFIRSRGVTLTQGSAMSIPVYGVTGLTEEIMAHLVECRAHRVVLMLDADDPGRAGAIDMAKRLATGNIEERSVGVAGAL